MVQIGKKINRRVGYVDDGKPKPLYTRYHRRPVQRDPIDQGYYVDVETNEPVLPGYHRTQGNYAPGELPEPSADLDQLRADLETFGYCLVANALSEAQLEVFRARVDEQARAERRLKLAGFSSASTDGIPTNQFLIALANKGCCFADAIEFSERSVARGELLDQLTTEMLGRDFICNSAAAAIAGPNGTPQALHCGQSMIPKPWPPWPYECFVGFLLDDFSEENGGTLVIPRSHRILTECGNDPVPPLPPTANATGPAGTALIMDGRLVHGTGANFSDALRRLIILTFHKPFIRQQEQWGLTLRPEVYANASEKLKSRLGFRAWHGGLGGFEGQGEGAIAPLRDDWNSVGELDGSSSTETGASYSVHASRHEHSARDFERMRAAGHLLATQDGD